MPPVRALLPAALAATALAAVPYAAAGNPTDCSPSGDVCVGITNQDPGLYRVRWSYSATTLQFRVT